MKNAFTQRAFAVALLILAAISVQACGGAEETAAQRSQKTQQTSAQASEQTSGDEPLPETDRPYLNKLLPEARRIQQEHGIPIDLTMAIAIQETGWGKHEIGQNNHFGLRCASDDCVTLNKDGANIRYETCPNEAECFNLFAKTLNELSDGNPGDVRALYRNGYATSPRWVRKVKSLRRQVRKTLNKAGISTSA